MDDGDAAQTVAERLFEQGYGIDRDDNVVVNGLAVHALAWRHMYGLTALDLLGLPDSAQNQSIVAALAGLTVSSRETAPVSAAFQTYQNATHPSRDGDENARYKVQAFLRNRPKLEPEYVLHATHGAMTNLRSYLVTHPAEAFDLFDALHRVEGASLHWRIVQEIRHFADMEMTYALWGLGIQRSFQLALLYPPAAREFMRVFLAFDRSRPSWRGATTQEDVDRDELLKRHDGLFNTEPE